MTNRTLKVLGLCIGGLPVAALGQVPDLVNTFDAGGSAMGMGSAGTVLGAETQTPFYNPAGLGYARKKQVGVAARNLPKSKSVATGDLTPSGSERVSASGSQGPFGLTHAGVILPFGNEGSGGALGVSITTGGVVRDDRSAGSGLTDGGVAAPAFRQKLETRTDFVTVAYGRSVMNGSLNWGAGLIYAINHQTLKRSAPSGKTSMGESPTGLGAILGIQYTPSNTPFSFGASYRTPIKLHSNGGSLVYPEIPGRFSAGAALRFDNVRNGRDYVVVAGQIDHYFASESTTYFPGAAQTVYGLGVEYSYQMGAARVPFRLGFSANPSSGRGFTDRNILNFGVGYRPPGDSWGLDLGFGKPSHGGSDFGLSMFYRFGK